MLYVPPLGHMKCYGDYSSLSVLWVSDDVFPFILLSKNWKANITYKNILSIYRDKDISAFCAKHQCSCGDRFGEP